MKNPDLPNRFCELWRNDGVNFFFFYRSAANRADNLRQLNIERDQDVLMAYREKNMNFWWYQAPPVIIAICIFILSSFSKLPTMELTFKWHDKVAHAIAYGTFAFFIARAFYYQNRFPGWRRNMVILAIVIATVYGALDEFHQSFVPGRMVDFWDGVADAVGATIGAFFFRWVLTRRWLPAL
ncbi:MAG: VanZ family protein [Calditrichae bacterium]|nr:VanZ family protein [Calditrichia bacterium]